MSEEDYNVCTGHGDCVANNTCICEDDYWYGENCQHFVHITPAGPVIMFPLIAFFFFDIIFIIVVVSIILTLYFYRRMKHNKAEKKKLKNSKSTEFEEFYYSKLSGKSATVKINPNSSPTKIMEKYTIVPDWLKNKDKKGNISEVIEIKDESDDSVGSESVNTSESDLTSDLSEDGDVPKIHYCLNLKCDKKFDTEKEWVVHMMEDHDDLIHLLTVQQRELGKKK